MNLGDTENPYRIEPSKLGSIPSSLNDLIAELASSTAALGQKLHPKTASNLADLVRLMNCYYSNLIEGHNTVPTDIERALDEDFDSDEDRRNLQIEAAAHIRAQRLIDQQYQDGEITEPADSKFVQWLHREFYRGASAEMLTIKGNAESYLMTPGDWRSRPEQDNKVGRHIPPASQYVDDFMKYFEKQYQFKKMQQGSRIIAMAASHHRFNFIHPFPDGNGRVSRLMSHMMGLCAGVGAHGLWSVSRGLARGLESRTEYKTMMDAADMPRQGDLDGRGNLSEKALVEFIEWYLKVCLDQVKFMSGLFDFEKMHSRLEAYVQRSEALKPEANNLLQEAFIRGEFERGEAARITGLPERTARRILNQLIKEEMLTSSTPKGPVYLKFAVSNQESLFPLLFPVS